MLPLHETHTLILTPLFSLLIKVNNSRATSTESVNLTWLTSFTVWLESLDEQQLCSLCKAGTFHDVKDEAEDDASCRGRGYVHLVLSQRNNPRISHCNCILCQVLRRECSSWTKTLKQMVLLSKAELNASQLHVIQTFNGSRQLTPEFCEWSLQCFTDPIDLLICNYTIVVGRDRKWLEKRVWWKPSDNTCLLYVTD